MKNPRITEKNNTVANKKLSHDLVGQGRSLAEELIIAMIRLSFPGIKIVRNDKSVLGRQEIDIHIPMSKIAIEVDGISHHSAIWGQERFLESQERDARKDARLAELGFLLYRIDISKMTKENLYPNLKKYMAEILIPELKKVIPSRCISPVDRCLK